MTALRITAALLALAGVGWALGGSTDASRDAGTLSASSVAHGRDALPPEARARARTRRPERMGTELLVGQNVVATAESDARFESQSERMLGTSRSRLSTLVAVAQLGAEDEAALKDLWEDEAEQLADLQRDVLQGTRTRTQHRGAQARVREETDAAAAEFLDEETYAIYLAHRPRGARQPRRDR